MRRRQLLTVCGTGLAGLAGCGGSQESTEEAGTPSGESTPTATEEPASTLTATPEDPIRFDALQTAALALTDSGYELVDAPDSQYLFLSGPDAVESSRFYMAGGEYSPGTTSNNPVHRAGSEFGTGSEGSGWVVFDLPESVDPSDAEFRGPGGDWRPNSSLRNRLRAPVPEVGLLDYTVEATDDGRPRFTVRVYNDSSVLDTRFVAIIGRTDTNRDTELVVSRRVPADEAVTLTATGEAVEGSTTGVGYDLTWPEGTETRSYPRT